MRVPLSAIVVLTVFRCHLEANETRAPVEIVISVREQRLALIHNGSLVRRFRVSTSRFGVGDKFGSYKTPLGRLRVCRKLGDNLPQGAVFRHRSFGGEVVRVNARGRDPIVTRILWLEGGEPGNRNARSRGIYIHGTPQERSLGKATSYGCVRMRSRDVVKIFDAVPIGTPVTIIAKKLPRVSKHQHATIIARKSPRPPRPNSEAEITDKMRSSRPEVFRLTAWFSKNRSQTGS